MTVSISRKHRIIHSYEDIFIIHHQNRSNVKQEKIKGNKSSDQSTSHHIKSVEQIVDQKQTTIQYHITLSSITSGIHPPFYLLHA